MGCHIHGAQLVDEVFSIVALVSAKRDAGRPVRAGFDHGQRRVAFGMAVRMSEAGFDHKAVAVFHQGMAHVAKLRFLALALAVKAGVGIGEGSVGLVGAFLPVKVHFGIAAPVRRGGRFSWRGWLACVSTGV
jgi:hypothetical protein